MLQGFVGVVLRHRAIFMVVVRLLLPVKHCVGRFLRAAEGRGLTGNGDHLPEGRDHQKNEDEPTTHRVSLVEPEKFEVVGPEIRRPSDWSLRLRRTMCVGPFEIFATRHLELLQMRSERHRIDPRSHFEIVAWRAGASVGNHDQKNTR